LELRRRGGLGARHGRDRDRRGNRGGEEQVGPGGLHRTVLLLCVWFERPAATSGSGLAPAPRLASSLSWTRGRAVEVGRGRPAGAGSVPTGGTRGEARPMRSARRLRARAGRDGSGGVSGRYRGAPPSGRRGSPAPPRRGGDRTVSRPPPARPSAPP